MRLRVTTWGRGPRIVLIPLVGLTLAVVACASVVIVYRQEVQNDRARLALADVKVQLSQLQGLPWQVGNRQYGSPRQIRRSIATTERSIETQLGRLLRSAPPASLKSVPRSLTANFATLERILSASPATASSSRSVPTTTLAETQSRTLGTAVQRLSAAGDVYAHRAAVAKWKSRIGFLGAIAGLFAGFLFYFRRSEKIRARLSAQATTDALTGLPNRGAFTDGVASCLDDRPARAAAVLFVDLDEFKDINDVFGHRGGDAVLREVAVRLHRHTRAGDLCARLGGDEFAVFLHGADAADAVTFARRIAAALGEPIVVGGGVARVGASIGIASASPDVDLETLVHWADVAMYAAKAAGNGRIEVFDPRLLAGETSRVAFEHQLAAAAGAGELVVHYQPIVSLADSRCEGVEALVRWQHPERGLLQPSEFIAVAERTGAIVDIGTFVLRRACSDAVAWQRATGRPITVYVNVSGRQLADDHFVDIVTAVLADVSLAPDQLVLELTESALLHSTGISDRLARLVARGVRVAIDDFGTGYASLTTLRSLPLDTVKIDRSFVARVTESAADEAVVATIVHMAARLGLRTIAEGVERREQQELLATLGAECVQGYLHLRPTVAERLLEWLCEEPDLAYAAPARAGGPRSVSARSMKAVASTVQ